MKWYMWVLLLIVVGLFIFLINKINKKNKIKLTVKELMYVVTFATLAIVVGFFEIPIGPTGLKFDFSEVVVLVTFLLIGYRGTSFVIVLRSMIRFLLPAKTGAEAEIMVKLIGEIIAVLASFLLLFSYSITKKIFRIKEKPLLLAVPTEIKKINIKFHIVNAVISVFLLTTVVSIFHVLFTVPIYNSFTFPAGDLRHYFITSYLKDPDYGDTFKKVVIFVIGGFALLNVIKAILSSILFLFLKPKIEQMMYNI